MFGPRIECEQAGVLDVQPEHWLPVSVVWRQAFIRRNVPKFPLQCAAVQDKRLPQWECACDQHALFRQLYT